MPAIILTVLGAVSAAASVFSADGLPIETHRIFKLLTMLIIIAIAATSIPSSRRLSLLYSVMIIIALALSAAGDLIITFEGGGFFIAAMSAFLISHVVYAAAFFKIHPAIKSNLVLAVCFLALGALVFAFLQKELGDLKLPILIYVAAIVFMLWRAISTIWSGPFTRFQALSVSIAAVLFFFSDFILATNKFKHPIANHNLITLSSYYAAQALFALSTYKRILPL